MRNLDFIIIGAMKSATSTLYEQLRLQPGIFLPDLKEPNFFSDDAQYAKGENWYLDLFSTAAPQDIVGEASTHYTKLPTYPQTVDRMGRMLAKPKLIYVMRHPIDRLISQYMHQWSEGTISGDIDQAIEVHRELISYSSYTSQLTPYMERYGPGAILPVFFERLKQAPDDTLAQICKFIGYQQQPIWYGDLSQANASVDRVRKFKGYNTLIESPPATWLRRKLVPKALRNKVKQRLSMNTRPTLSPSSRKYLETEFDQDLAELGNWLGLDLNCGNFSSTTAARPLNWAARFTLS